MEKLGKILVFSVIGVHRCSSVVPSSPLFIENCMALIHHPVGSRHSRWINKCDTPILESNLAIFRLPLQARLCAPVAEPHRSLFERAGEHEIILAIAPGKPEGPRTL